MMENMNIASVARSAGMDKKQLYAVLNGQRELKADEFLAICRVLHVDPSMFMPEAV